MRFIFIAILTIFIFSGAIFAQDSLFKLMAELDKKSKKDELPVLKKLAESYLDYKNDSCLFYALYLAHQANTYKNTFYEGWAFYLAGKANRRLGNYDEAEKYFRKAENLFYKVNNLSLLSDVYNNLGILDELRGNYSKALVSYQQALTVSEHINNKKSKAKILNNLGNLNFTTENYDKAIDCYQSAYKMNTALQNQMGIAASLNNIGNVYNFLEDYDKAISFYNQSLEIKEKNGDKKGIAATLNNIGDIYYEKKQYNRAFEYFSKSIEIEQECGNIRGAAESLENISVLYLQIGQYSQALSYCTQSLNESKKSGYSLQEMNAYYRLSSIHDSIGNIDSAFRYYKQFIYIKDSLFNVEKYQYFKDLEAKYENQKQEQEIELLSKDKELQNQALAKQKILIYSLIGVGVLLIILAFLLYNRYRIKQFANSRLTIQNQKINKQKAEIESQRDEIIAQRDLAEKQRDQIHQQQKKIIDSINYAKFIQRASLPPDNFLNEFFADNFILFKPKELVSGDFYWIDQRGKYIVVAAADCTGHGVPGGFLSMMGIAYLNDIVNKKSYSSNNNEIKANEILNLLKHDFSTSLGKNKYQRGAYDGMDIALCVINKETRELQFSGAFNYLVIIHQNELIELKGDKIPIGLTHYKNETYTNHKWQLNSGDSIYMYTDGFSDQFGGKHEKKFLRKNLKKLLFQNYQEPMKSQKQILESTFKEWKQDTPQLDDILIIGIKI